MADAEDRDEGIDAATRADELPVGDATDAVELALLDPLNPAAAPQATDASLPAPAADYTQADLEPDPDEIVPTQLSADIALERTQAELHGFGDLSSATPTAMMLPRGAAMSGPQALSSPVPELSDIGEPVLLTTPVDGVDVSMLSFDAPPRTGGSGLGPGPAVVGGYRVDRRLGQGGMAEVFLARPPGSEHQVVLKRVHPALVEDPRMELMLRREARLASALEHPNIVRILDFAEEPGSLFLVMEHLDGCDLRELAGRWWGARRPLPVEVVVAIVEQAATGLDHAHHAPTGALVHRDISPENLFLTRDGLVKILDFGIAKELDENEGLTRTGEVKGKVPYMSPEQIQGQPLDGRSDLWSLSVVLYWLLTGHRPFDGATDFMTIKQIVDEEPVGPGAVNDLVPASVEGVVLQGLQKDPGRRPQRGRDLAAALGALLAPLPASASDLKRFAADALGLSAPSAEVAPYHPAAVPFSRWPPA